MLTPRQTLLDEASLARLGLACCPACGAGMSLGEMCLYEDGEDGGITTHAVWCRDCETGTEGLTLAEAVGKWNHRAATYST